MDKSNKIINLLVLALILVLVGIISLFLLIEGEKSNLDVEFSQNNSLKEIKSNKTQNNVSSHKLILTSFEGEYEKDGQTVVVSENGEQYIVEDGYVLTGGLRVDATQDSKISVYELEKRQ